jgi:hypothetical protein|tara:strand:- start:468 stop:656 length:189 start_codon:yes stop_codon:yes gene_type:complete
MTATRRIAGLEARYEALLKELTAAQLHQLKLRKRVSIAYAKLGVAKVDRLARAIQGSKGEAK